VLSEQLPQQQVLVAVVEEVAAAVALQADHSRHTSTRPVPVVVLQKEAVLVLGIRHSLAAEAVHHQQM
jgi:hypothetical protein